MTVPDLPRHCASWVVVAPRTGRAVAETFSRANAERFAALGYDVLSAFDWLGRVNRAARGEG